MKRTILLALLALVFHPAVAQDSARVARLEQDIRQLQREVLNLTQLVNQLRAGAGAPAPSASRDIPTVTRPQVPAGPAAALPSTLPRWIDATRWSRLRSAMSELEVITELGPPTSARVEGPSQVLLYALELGPSTFLVGSVVLRDHAVVEIQIPALK